MRKLFLVLLLAAIVGCPTPTPPIPPIPPTPPGPGPGPDPKPDPKPDPDPRPFPPAVGVYVVIESASLREQPESVVLWLNSQKLKDDMKAKGIAFYRIDPDLIDKKGGTTPKELVALFDYAKKQGLPCVVLIEQQGAMKGIPLPLDETAARKLFGL